MDSARLIVWVERLTWVLVFGGLLTLVVGLAARGADGPTAWTLIAVGGVATAAGVLLIWVRSRLDSGPS